MTTLAIPDEADITALCEWYVANIADIDAARSFLSVTARRLNEYIREVGPVVTASGRLEILPNGWDWNDELIAEVMPSLITAAIATFTGTQPEIERVLSLVTEELPDLEFTVKRTVDKRAAAGVFKQGGAAAEKLAPARTPVGKLGVR